MTPEEIKAWADRLYQEAENLSKDLNQPLSSLDKKYTELINQTLRETLIDRIESETEKVKSQAQSQKFLLGRGEEFWVFSTPQKVGVTRQKKATESFELRVEEKVYRLLPLEAFEIRMNMLKASISDGKLDEDLKMKTEEAIYETMSSKGKLWLKITQSEP